MRGPVNHRHGLVFSWESRTVSHSVSTYGHLLHIRHTYTCNVKPTLCCYLVSFRVTGNIVTPHLSLPRSLPPRLSLSFSSCAADEVHSCKFLDRKPCAEWWRRSKTRHSTSRRSSRSPYVRTYFVEVCRLTPKTPCKRNRAIGI